MFEGVKVEFVEYENILFAKICCPRCIGGSMARETYYQLKCIACGYYIIDEPAAGVELLEE